jgi:hypothetical protein
MSDIRRILIASYTFPPQGGIGGRRWAKLAKALQRTGFRVEVLAADLGDTAKSPWTGDVRELVIHRFKTAFPRVLTTSPRNVSEKIQYRLALEKMRLKTSGTPYDRAALDRKEVWELLHERMEVLQPDVVIGTGAPFDLLHHLASRRGLYPNAVFLADLRDPWLTGTAFGYRELPEARMKQERIKEREVVEAFDLLTMPWDRNIEELGERYPSYRRKMHVLPHFFDEDEVKGKGTSTPNGPDILYGGSIYEGLEPTLKELSRFCADHQRTARLYSSDHNKAPASNPFFQFAPIVSAPDFFSMAAKSKYLLLFLPEGNRHGLTKLIEYAACGRPVLAVGKESHLSELIENKGLGRFIDSDHFYEGLQGVFESDLQYSPDLEWIEKYSLKGVGERLLNMLKRIEDG